jgi:hypothetical protein
LPKIKARDFAALHLHVRLLMHCLVRKNVANAVLCQSEGPDANTICY